MKDELRIVSDIKAIPQGRNCALIIRHGDRDGPLNQVVKETEGLNETGIVRSRRLGEMLTKFSEMETYSSPVGRCTETCRHVSVGFGRCTEPVSIELLGMSAPFMVDPRQAYLKMREVGLEGFVDLYVNDSLDRNMVLPCKEGTKMLLSYAIQRIERLKGGVGIFVTHDMIITPPMAYYFDYDFKTNGLVPFLDGVVLYQDGDGYVSRYDGKEMYIDADGTPMR